MFEIKANGLTIGTTRSLRIALELARGIAKNTQCDTEVYDVEDEKMLFDYSGDSPILVLDSYSFAMENN